jgi:glutamate N-acetyltransferase/amino-acid N-acetyltransferase
LTELFFFVFISEGIFTRQGGIMSNIRRVIDLDIDQVQGFRANGVQCEIRKKDKFDLGIVYSEVPASVFGVYTTNKYQAAPVLVCKEHLAGGKGRALVVNSGIANACTGDEGLKNARLMCEETAKILGIRKEEVAVGSTGVIGMQLPMDKIIGGIRSLKEKLLEKNHFNFTHAIMTTDTRMKNSGVKIKLKDKEYTIFGTAKGSGMIHPNMATMLAYVFTDADIEPSLLEETFKDLIDRTFNSITVDGDTSTNDTALIFANGKAGNIRIARKDESYQDFRHGLEIVLTELSKKIVEDGEGATKLIEIQVKGAHSEKDAKLIGQSIAQSSLVKTAFFGEDANWGRIICAAGYSGADFDPDKVSLKIGGLLLFEKGMNVAFSEEEAKKILASKEITVLLEMNQGDKNWTVWTCDLSYDYVKINGSYRS